MLFRPYMARVFIILVHKKCGFYELPPVGNVKVIFPL